MFSVKPLRSGRYGRRVPIPGRRVLTSFCCHDVNPPTRRLPADVQGVPTAPGPPGGERKWAADGTWEKVFTALLAQADAEGGFDWVVAVDSTNEWL